MRRNLKWFALGVLLILTFDTEPAPLRIAYACSGGSALNIQELTEASEIVVWGTVTETDDAQQNGTFLVKEYWKGSGGEVLTITQRTTAEIFSLFDVGSTGDCFFFDTFFQEGENRVMFLYRHFDGSYGTTTYDLEPPYVFPTEDATVEDWTYQDGEYVRETLTLSQMRERISMVAATEPHEPNDTPYTPTPILIRTTNGNAYMLPINGREPMLLAEGVRHIFKGQEIIAVATDNEFFIVSRFDGDPFWENQDGNKTPFHTVPDFSQCDLEICFAFAPIYNYVVFTLDENTLMVCHNPRYCMETEFNSTIIGQAFSISLTGESIAVWNEDAISIYPIHKHYHYFFARQPYEPDTTIALNPNLPIETIGKGAWSSDNTWFAYSDREGLWLADLISTEQQPVLLIPAENAPIPIATGFSEQGRYIFVEQGETRFLYDLRTQQTAQYTFVTPDDRLPINLYAQDVYVEVDNQPKLLWINNRQALYMVTNYDNRYKLVSGKAEHWAEELRSYDYGISAWDVTWTIGDDFDYEPISGAILVHNDSTHISIDGRTLDLASYLDSEIVSVEWLPMIFYRE